MGDKSKIEWTDATWNPTTGCRKVSPGCAKCYAERMAKRTFGCECGHQHAKSPRCHQCECTEYRPRPFTDVRMHHERLDTPLRWKRPRRVFVDSMSDLFHELVDTAFITSVFRVMAQAKAHTFQVLTKRPVRMQEQLRLVADSMAADNGACIGWPLPNVWLGVSVEDQQRADERVPVLLETPAAVRFLSCEPLLGPVDLTHVATSGWSCNVLTGYALHATEDVGGTCTRVDWVIVGGESGVGFRHMEYEWAIDLVRSCRAAKVPVFVKQLSGWPVERELAKFPKALQHREWPEVTR